MPSNIKEKVHELKRHIILDAAAVAFESSGYENLKVSELSKTVGVSVGTIYTLFDSKEGLYLAYVERIINSSYEMLLQRIHESDSVEQKIQIYISLKFTNFHQKRNAVIDGAQGNPLFFSSLHGEFANPLQKFYQFLVDCIQEVNPEYSDEVAMNLAYALNGLSDGYVSRWLEVGGNLLEKVDEVCELYMLLITRKTDPCHS